MKSIFLKSSVFALSFAFLSVGHIAVVDAKRLGGGSNVGRSANAPVQKQAQPTAQQKPAQQAQQPAATTPPQAAALVLDSKWLRSKIPACSNWVKTR